MDYDKIKQEAKDALSGHWTEAVVAYMVIGAISLFVRIIPLIGSIGALLLSGALAVGFSRFCLNIIRSHEAKVEDAFWGFKQYERSLGASLLVLLYVFLWALLLIIPGIIKAISYSQVYFILADDENVRISEALKRSEQMMDGYKVDLIVLHLTFIGWAILCVFTCFIGFLWLGPWIQVSLAKFYLEVKSDWETRMGIYPSQSTDDVINA